MQCNDQQIVLTLLLSLGVENVAEKSVEMAQEDSIFHLELKYYGMSVMCKVLIDTYLPDSFISLKGVIILPLQTQNLS